MHDKTKEAMAERVRKCMEDKGIEGPTALYRLMVRALSAAAHSRPRQERQTITRQTVSNWMGGKVYPSMDLLPVLAEVLGTEEEWLLFGSKRSKQLRSERQYLSRVTEEEGRLLTAYREASKDGQKTILKLAQGVAENHPAHEASIHLLRRKDDKINNS